MHLIDGVEARATIDVSPHEVVPRENGIVAFKAIDFILLLGAGDRSLPLVPMQGPPTTQSTIATGV